jgi:hypothetical protein
VEGIPVRIRIQQTPTHRYATKGTSSTDVLEVIEKAALVRRQCDPEILHKVHALEAGESVTIPVLGGVYVNTYTLIN